MLNFTLSILLVSLADAFAITLAKKWGIVEYLQVHADDWVYRLTKIDTNLLNQLFSCDFCMSWWISWFFSLILCMIQGDWMLVAVPFFATPLGRKLL